MFALLALILGWFQRLAAWASTSSKYPTREAYRSWAQAHALEQGRASQNSHQQAYIDENSPEYAHNIAQRPKARSGHSYNHIHIETLPNGKWRAVEIPVYSRLQLTERYDYAQGRLDHTFAEHHLQPREVQRDADIKRPTHARTRSEPQTSAPALTTTHTRTRHSMRDIQCYFSPEQKPQPMFQSQPILEPDTRATTPCSLQALARGANTTAHPPRSTTPTGPVPVRVGWDKATSSRWIVEYAKEPEVVIRTVEHDEPTKSCGTRPVAQLPALESKREGSNPTTGAAPKPVPSGPRDDDDAPQPGSSKSAIKAARPPATATRTPQSASSSKTVTQQPHSSRSMPAVADTAKPNPTTSVAGERWMAEATTASRKSISETRPLPPNDPSSRAASSRAAEAVVISLGPASTSMPQSSRSGDKRKTTSATGHHNATPISNGAAAKVPEISAHTPSPTTQVAFSARPVPSRAVKSESAIPKTKPTSSTPSRRAASERRPLPPIPVTSSTTTINAPVTRPPFDMIALVKSNKINWDAQCHLWYFAAMKHGELVRWRREWIVGKRPTSKIHGEFVEEVMRLIKDNATETEPTTVEIAKPPFDIMLLLKADKQLWDEQRGLWYAMADKVGELSRWKREWDAGLRPSGSSIDDQLVEAILKKYSMKSKNGKSKHARQTRTSSSPGSNDGKRGSTSSELRLVPSFDASISEHKLRRWRPSNRRTQSLTDDHRPEPNSKYLKEWTTFPRSCLKPHHESSVRRPADLKGKRRVLNVHWTDESWDERIWYREEMERQECEDSEARALEPPTAPPPRRHSWGPKSGESSKSVDALILAHPDYEEHQLARLWYGWSRGHVVELYKQEMAVILRCHWEEQKREATIMLETVDKFQKGEMYSDNEYTDI